MSLTIVNQINMLIIYFIKYYIFNFNLLTIYPLFIYFNLIIDHVTGTPKSDVLMYLEH
jgi:hypothetical protein